MKRHKQLWDKVASIENLMEAARETMYGKRGKRAGAAFFQIWEKEVVRLARELDVGSSWTGSAFGFSPDKPLLAARIAEGKCRPRPCRAQEPPEKGEEDARGGRERLGEKAERSAVASATQLGWIGGRTLASRASGRMGEDLVVKKGNRFILEITRHAGKDEPLFEITRCLAVGWIRGERDAEEEWGK